MSVFFCGRAGARHAVQPGSGSATARQCPRAACTASSPPRTRRSAARCPPRAPSSAPHAPPAPACVVRLVSTRDTKGSPHRKTCLRHQRVQAQRRCDEEAHAWVARRRRCCQRRQVLLPVAPRRQEVGAHNNRGRAVRHARVERVGDAGRSLRSGRGARCHDVRLGLTHGSVLPLRPTTRAPAPCARGARCGAPSAPCRRPQAAAAAGALVSTTRSRKPLLCDTGCCRRA